MHLSKYFVTFRRWLLFYLSLTSLNSTLQNDFDEGKKKTPQLVFNSIWVAMWSEAWADLHMAQAPTARGERNRLNTSIKSTSFTCRNTKLSVTQQAAGPSPRTLLHLISHPLWTCVFKMCATFLSFTPLIGSTVCADYKSYLIDSFYISSFKQSPLFNSAAVLTQVQ